MKVFSLRLGLAFALLGLAIETAGQARADLIFDTNSQVVANGENFWPFGDADNTRHQIWLSQDSLSGITGPLQSIKFFVINPKNIGASYDLDILASTTSLSSNALSPNDLDANHGADKTVVYSGIFTSDASFTFNLNGNFDYNNSGNLLLDFVFRSFTGVGNFYDGPTFQAMPDSGGTFARVTNHNVEGNLVLTQGVLRTQLAFAAVPEPATVISGVMGGLLVVGLARRRPGAKPRA